MGSVDKKQAHIHSGEKFVSVQTTELKEKLNRIYAHLRKNATKHSVHGHFDLLWDLKELALLEHRQSVDVPESWLAETEDLDNANRLRQGH